MRANLRDLTARAITSLRQGTGERCSNSAMSRYQCGLGTFCLCGRCQGCSLYNYSDCYEETINCVGTW